MMGLRRAAAWVLGFCVCASACSDTTPPPQPATFERPTRLAFVCVDKNRLSTPELALAPLSACTPPPPPPVGTTAPMVTTAYTLHAVITQSSRGEVGAVDIPALSAIDTRKDIPGPTFVPTGELPVAVAIAPDHPHWTYVANAGSRDISVIRTASLLHVSAGEAYLHQEPVPVRLQDATTAVVPFDMAISPDQDALFVTSAEAGLLLRYPIVRCGDGCPNDGRLDVAHMTSIALADSWSKLSPDAFMQGDTRDEPYRFACDQSKPPSYPPLLSLPNSPVELPMPNASVPTAQPAGMAIDAFCAKGEQGCTRRLLIADRAQPIIHAVDLDALADGKPEAAILTPILSGAPTERVVVTPRVPVSVTDATPTQYVYAIDARDGSVLVAQNGRTVNVSVNPGVRADRLDFGQAFADGPPVALSLAVLTPQFKPFGPPDQWATGYDETPDGDNPLLCLDPDHQTRLVNRLRGVFLAVGLTDGSVRIVTVHDMELAACRDCNTTDVPSYVAPFNAGYDPYPVVRNRTRIALGIAAVGSGESPTIVPAVSAQFMISTTAIGVKFDGTTDDPRVPGLDCIACSETQDVSFPAPGAFMPLDGGLSVGSSDQTSGTTSPLDAGVANELGETSGNVYTGCANFRQGRVCSAHDPWVDPLSWSASYEGAIPGTRGGHGRFVDAGENGNESGSLEFRAEVDFCAAGVQGDDLWNPGDQLQITSPLPADAVRNKQPQALRELCDALVNARDVNYEAIAFRIRKAYGNHLVIEPQAIHSRARRPDATWDNVRDCFGGMELAFQVHARASFVVQGSGTAGFLHRVVKNAGTGHCEIDNSLPETRSSRAYPGRRFDNGVIAFQPSAGDYDPQAVLNFASTSSTPKTFFNAGDIVSTLLRGVMPIDIRYSASDNRMYVLDVTSRGLMPVPLDPMPTTLDLSYSIQ